MDTIPCSFQPPSILTAHLPKINILFPNLFLSLLSVYFSNISNPRNSVYFLFLQLKPNISPLQASRVHKCSTKSSVHCQTCHHLSSSTVSHNFLHFATLITIPFMCPKRNERGKMIPSTTVPVQTFLLHHHNIMPANFIIVLSG
jgi:hypothetical protein